jgi:hypothetical protein
MFFLTQSLQHTLSHKILLFLAKSLFNHKKWQITTFIEHPGIYVKQLISKYLLSKFQSNTVTVMES